MKKSPESDIQTPEIESSEVQSPITQGFKYKYKRFGAYIIDTAIIYMYTWVFFVTALKLFIFTFNKFQISIAMNDFNLLIAMVAHIFALFFIVIMVNQLYHRICYRLLKTSLSRYFLRLSVETTNGEEITKSRYLNREFKKIYFTVMTLGIYPLYHGAQFFAHGKAPWHDKHFETEVIHY